MSNDPIPKRASFCPIGSEGSGLYRSRSKIWSVLGSTCAVALSSVASATPSDNFESKIDALVAQNQKLMELAQAQQAEIAELRARIDAMDDADKEQQSEIESLQQSFATTPAVRSNPSPARRGLSERIRISGDAGFAFFAGESNTEFPNEEFHVDNIRVNVEAEIARGIYLTAMFQPFLREPPASESEVGEFFVDFENPFRFDDYRLLNFRVGRFQIPFGEEYLHRYTMENPLVSHSIADIWGVDEGVELFGNANRLSYTLAIQNGSRSTLRDFDSEKSLTARLGYDLGERIRLSASWMDTGDLDVASREFSEVWIGNVVFIPIGSAQTTKYSAELAQLDAAYHWNGGFLKTAYGQSRYTDNDPAADNSRDIEFYHVEARQYLAEKLYGAARYSYMGADGGFPLAGHGPRATYFTGGVLTEDLERLSLGLGYWAREDAVLKLEYSFEDGEQPDGTQRANGDRLAAEVGVRF